MAEVKASIAPVDLERMVELDFVRTTEAAAFNAHHWLGKGDAQVMYLPPWCSAMGSSLSPEESSGAKNWAIGMKVLWSWVWPQSPSTGSN